jgi:CheY-like chemotaxis protein
MARILLAESDRRIGGFIAGILADFGHDVTLCADAGEAGARLAAEPMDVLLTDLMLKGGLDAALSGCRSARDIPLITLTGLVVSAHPPVPAPPPLVDKPFRFADLQSVLDAVALCTAGDRTSQPAIAEAA